MGGIYAQHTPSDLNSTAPLTFPENLPIGTIIGEFNATDPDVNSTLTYYLTQTGNHSLFTLETNGTLRTATTFDFESDLSSYSVRIQARDEHNATIEGNFTIALTDIFEDNDGDGFSNQMEAIAGTNPNTGQDRPTIDFGLVGHYPFDGDASDHSGFNNHGTIIGGIAPTSDRNLMPGQALSFNGTDAMITIPHSESLEFLETQGMSPSVGILGTGDRMDSIDPQGIFLGVQAFWRGQRPHQFWTSSKWYWDFIR